MEVSNRNGPPVKHSCLFVIANHPLWRKQTVDTDPAINSFAAQNWTSHLGFKEIESWRPWTVDGCRRMGGYITRYEGNFDFLTIRGAGHMVSRMKCVMSKESWHPYLTIFSFYRSQRTKLTLLLPLCDHGFPTWTTLAMIKIALVPTYIINTF